MATPAAPLAPSDPPLDRLILPADWQRQPWKNGGGVTHEVFREPVRGSDLLGRSDVRSSGASATEAFALRLSCAEVASAGPFSRFPGVDRTIALLDGSGFTLRRADGPTVTLRDVGQLFAFSGDDAWHCDLVDGPVLDLNVMVNRAACKAEVSLAHLPPDVSLHLAAPRLVVFALAPLHATTRAGASYHLERHHTLVASDGIELLWTGSAPLRSAFAAPHLAQAVVVRVTSP